jgi:hypothetical protein
MVLNFNYYYLNHVFCLMSSKTHLNAMEMHLQVETDWVFILHCVFRIKAENVSVYEVYITSSNTNTADTPLCMSILTQPIYVHKIKFDLPCWWKCLSVTLRWAACDALFDQRGEISSVSRGNLWREVARFLTDITWSRSSWNHEMYTLPYLVKMWSKGNKQHKMITVCETFYYENIASWITKGITHGV